MYIHLLYEFRFVLDFIKIFACTIPGILLLTTLKYITKVKYLLESTFGLRIWSRFVFGVSCLHVRLHSAVYILPHGGTPGLFHYFHPGQYPCKLVLGRCHQMMLLRKPVTWRKEKHSHAIEQRPPWSNTWVWGVQGQTVLGNPAALLVWSMEEVLLSAKLH